MPRLSRKGRAGSSSSSSSAAPPKAKAVKRTSTLPPPESIISVETFTSPKSGKTYSVVETTETDAYDKVKPEQAKRLRRTKKKSDAGD